MQKLLIGAVVGGMAGLGIGVVFAAGGLLVTHGLVDHATSVIGLCGGVAGFVGMFIGALSGATHAVGGGNVKACVAAVGLGFAVGALAARHVLGTQAGGIQLLYAAAGAFGAACVAAWRGRRARRHDAAPSEARPWRRWFQFRLSTLMAMVVLACALLATLVSPTAMRRRAQSALRQQGVRLDYEESFPSWLSFMFGQTTLAGETVWCAYLDGAKVNDTTLVWLGTLAEVRDVSIHSALVTDEGFKHVKRLARLELLDVQFAPITDAGLESLRELKHLKRLSLAATKVTDAGLASLEGLTELQDLDLRGTLVTGPGLASLERLTKLTQLNLDGTPVTDAGLKHLRGLTNLKCIHLSRTTVSDAGLVDLEDLPELMWVGVWSTKVTAAGDERMQEVIARRLAQSQAKMAEGPNRP